MYQYAALIPDFLEFIFGRSKAAVCAVKYNHLALRRSRKKLRGKMTGAFYAFCSLVSLIS